MPKEAVLRAMVSMSRADKTVSSDEIIHITEIYADVTGEIISSEDVVAAIQAHKSGELQALPYLREIAPKLDNQTKEQLIKATYRILICDANVASEERKKLVQIARAINMREIHYKAVLEDVE